MKKATSKEFRYFAQKQGQSIQTNLSQASSPFIKKFEFKLPEI